MPIQPPLRPDNRVSAYLLALLGVVLATAIRFEMGAVLGGTIPVVMYTVPVAVAALYGGFGPGLFATLTGALVSDFLFIEPVYRFGLETKASVVVILTFLITGLTISYVGHRMKALQGRLAEQANKLAAANRELEQGDRRKDEFLAMLAHELRNPLAGISTAAELLKRSRDAQPRTVQTGDIIGRQVRHMTKLVDDLLDVSRVTRGLVIIERIPVDLKDAVQGAVEQVKASLAAKRQQLALDLPDSDIFVCGDRIRLTQVISNLLANAAKYSPEERAVKVVLRATADVVQLEVADQGQGIDPGLLPHVFDLFVQAERSPDRSQGGLGIGLALVRRIVELHEGSVAAHSEGAGMGSLFTVRLPRLVQAHGGQAGDAAAPLHTAGRMRILVVDDNKDAADTVALLLDACGHTVSVEYGADAALARGRAERFDAIILDIGLPDMDGRALRRELGAAPHLRDTVFIALSGYGQEQDRRASTQAGFARHLVKPVDTDELIAALGAGRSGT